MLCHSTRREASVSHAAVTGLQPTCCSESWPPGQLCDPHLTCPASSSTGSHGHLPSRTSTASHVRCVRAGLPPITRPSAPPCPPFSELCACPAAADRSRPRGAISLSPTISRSSGNLEAVTQRLCTSAYKDQKRGAPSRAQGGVSAGWCHVTSQQSDLQLLP